MGISLTINFILFALFCSKGARSVTLDHDSLKKVRVENRIKGGEETIIEEHPYVAFLAVQESSGPGPTCSGAIITRRNIVTSALCLLSADYVDVRVGSTDRTKGGQEYTTSVFMVHPMYKGGERDYDVGILVIEEGMATDGNTVDIIDIVGLHDDPSPGDLVTIMGWGKVGPKLFDPISVNLKKTEFNIISRGHCKNDLPDVTNRLFCAIDEKGSDAICKGDLGDPVVDDNGLLAGIVSRTNNCNAAKPQLITRFGEAQIRSFITATTTA